MCYITAQSPHKAWCTIGPCLVLTQRQPRHLSLKDNIRQSDFFRTAQPATLNVYNHPDIQEKRSMSTVMKETEKELLTPAQRWLEASTVVAMLLLLAFLVYHQQANTGFFTARFGAAEMFCLYGPILLALIAPAIRAVTGRRNPARPFDAATSLSLALGSLWLLIVFPFDFSHLADALPGALRFVLAWVTNAIGRIPLILQVIIGPISAISTTWKYFSTRRQEPEPYFEQGAS
jgi:hypothetical protein